MADSLPSPESVDNVSRRSSVSEQGSLRESPYNDHKYLTLSDEIMCTTSVAELEEAVALCKEQILGMEETHPDRSMMVRRLIELRLRLHVLQEASKDELQAAELVEPLQERSLVLGHHFLRQNHPKSLATCYCDRCSGVIWNAIHSWHLCIDCDYRCHTWCLNQVCRVCAHVIVSESHQFEMTICPEAPNGLAAQNYRCIECLQRTKPGGSSSEEARLCDYDGKYYCTTCHWNSTAVIPARVISNWDFLPRRVSRASNQKLRILSQLPIIQLETLNPVLFASVDELQEVKALRKRLISMKKYLTSCKKALDENLTWRLKDRVHFLENDDKYSVQDLIDLNSGVLIEDLTRLMRSFETHITNECAVCKGHGYFCEWCKNNDVIYPFSKYVECCPVCNTTYHISCWMKNNQDCRKCIRRAKRQS